MSEIIANLEYTVSDEGGRQYYVNVAGEAIDTAQWEAWLEFLPLDASEPLLTGTEARGTTRGDVVDWAATLTETDVRQAFERATRHDTVRIDRTATPLYPDVLLASAATIDPFEVFRLGKDVLRTQLRPLTRVDLLTMIDLYDLNPARVSLVRLSTSQLVTFIVTATEAQVLQGRQ